MERVIETFADLQMEIEERMGPGTNPIIAVTIADELTRHGDCPDMGEDWSEFLSGFKLWEFAEELGANQN